MTFTHPFPCAPGASIRGAGRDVEVVLGIRAHKPGGTIVPQLVRSLGALLALGMLSGCYNYAPVGMDAVAPGAEIRANLTTEKSFELERDLGERRSVVEGEVVEAGPLALLLSVPWTYRDPRLGQTALRQRIRVQENEVIRLEMRTLDRPRSAIVLGAVGVVAGVILFHIFGPDEVGETIRPGPPNGEV